MKPLPCAVLAFAALCGVAFAREPAPELTAFEAFASRSTAIVHFTHEVATLDSSDAKATATVLILEDTANPPDRMRGARFDLENNTGRAHVYLGEAELTSLRRAIAGLEAGSSLLEREDSAPYRVQGTEACWAPRPPVRILCPSNRVGPDWSGIGLGIFGGPGFSFPERRPSDLADFVDRVIAALDETHY